MIQIAIVDDESRQIRFIQQSIQKFFRQKNREDDYRMDTFHSGESLLMSSRSYDLIFLDIQMNGMDGIETAKKIRTWDRKVCVIYVSNYTEKMAASFIVHPFSFLPKPIRQSDIYKNLEDFLLYTQPEEPKTRLVFQTLEEQISVNMEDIFYFEYGQNRRVKLVATTGTWYLSSSMKSLEKQMESYGFLVPHKSFLVNPRQILSFGAEIQMKNHEMIPIAKNRRKQVHEQISAYLHNSLNINWRD
ncbi:MAG: LytTR family DNA-binding domain-containing protein [Ruminococcus sp.]|nr:LytTR family DNA-binding domain-containing protein [Ruminococcus sp.]